MISSSLRMRSFFIQRRCIFFFLIFSKFPRDVRRSSDRLSYKNYYQKDLFIENRRPKVILFLSCPASLSRSTSSGFSWANRHRRGDMMLMQRRVLYTTSWEEREKKGIASTCNGAHRKRLAYVRRRRRNITEDEQIIIHRRPRNIKTETWQAKERDKMTSKKPWERA